MRLFTWHDPGFDLTSTKVDSGRQCDFLKEAYDWLFKIIGTHDVIWCWSDVDRQFNCHAEEVVLWELEVPEEHIIRKINSTVWTYVVGGWNYLPDELGWWYDLPTEEFDAKQMQWQKENPWRGWDKLFEFKSEDEEKDAEYLISSPVKKEWVVNKTWSSSWCLENFEGGIERVNFVKKENALHYREAFLNFLKDFPHEETLTEQSDGSWTFYCKWDGDQLFKERNII